MEILTVLLSSLLLVISPVGIVVDQVAENAIRSRLADAESLEVRIDNGPSYQFLQGKVSKVRIAGRGISPIPGFRIDLAELETDPIDLAFGPLRNGEVVLDKAFQGAAHLVLTEADVNTFLASPFVKERLAQLKIGGLNAAQSRERDRYQIVNPTVDFLESDRIKITVELEDLVVEDAGLFLEAETGLAILEGDRLTLDSPTLSVNGQPAPDRLITTVLGDFSNRLSLQQFDERGLTARVLNLGVEEETLDLALWVRVDPSVTAPEATTPVETGPVE
ncbi:MAG: DUF2993 domain-containing protein [Cyanobacteria bacterium J06621_11]